MGSIVEGVKNIGRRIGNAVKELFGIGSRGSDSVGSTTSYDEQTASVAETYRLQQELSKFREDTRVRSDRFENDVIRESRRYLDALMTEVKKYNKIRYGGSVLNVNLVQMERENRKTEDQIHGFIVSRIVKRISLDDEECKSILKLDPGRQKTRRLNEFYRKVLTEALTELKDLLREAMKNQVLIVEDHIVSRMDTITYTVTNKTNEFNKIQDIKDTDESKMEQEQIRLSYLIAMCDKSCAIMDE